MVQSRKEPTISSADLNTPLDEEMAPKRSRRASAASPEPSKQPTAKPAKSGGFGVMMVGFLALIALAGSGYLFVQLTAVSQQLSAASDRITELEKQLTLTDDEASQSVTALQANLKQSAQDIATNESEIRKLWDTRNVNRGGISRNKEQLAKLDQQTSRQLDALKKTLAGVQSSQQASSAEQKVLTQELSALAQQLKTVQSQLASVNKLASQVEGVSQLQRRVRGNEEAIEAIDAYRLNINRQLLDLQNRINQAQTP